MGASNKIVVSVYWRQNLLASSSVKRRTADV